MTGYFDASAFVPLFLDDSLSEAVGKGLAALGMDYAVSDLTMIEAASAASRAVRARRTSESAALEALDDANQWVATTAVRHAISTVDFSLADAFVRRFDLGLRPADALHVAICRRLGLALLTCDQAQAKAARILGVETIDLSGGSS